MEEESWKRDHGRGIMDEESWERNHGGGIMEADVLGSIWEASEGHLRGI